MSNKPLLLVMLILVVMASGCTKKQAVFKENVTAKQPSVCGDNICSLNEDCNNCAKDCKCKPTEYCSSDGICKAYVCGDGICSTEEKNTNSCCEDCGCQADNVCNKIVQKCLAKIPVSEEKAREIAINYTNTYNISGTITQILDTFYKNETIKQVNIDCKTKDSKFPCMEVLYINKIGEIIEVFMTA